MINKKEIIEGVIKEKRNEKYEIGVFDCLIFTCIVVERITDRKVLHLFKGKYWDERSSLKLMLSFGKSFKEAISNVLKAQPIELVKSRTGDVLLFNDVNKTPHLGIYYEGSVVLTMKDGLTSLPFLSCETAWSLSK